VHKNPIQRAFVLANGDLSGSWPVHVREAEDSATSGVGSERLISLDQRPTVWYDARAQSAGLDYVKGTPLPLVEYGLTTPRAGQTALIPDNAHQPSIAFVPYLLTGDRYYAEEMAFWANYGMLRTSDSDGIRGGRGILENNEVPGIAWALRNLVDAAAYYPDASPVKSYLSEKVLNNLQWLDTYASVRNAGSNPNAVMWTGLRPEGPEYIALWEQNALAYALDRANKLGFAGGLAHRDAIAKFQLTLFTSDPDFPRAHAAPSAVAVGTPDGDSLTFFQTIAEIWSGTAARTRPFAGYYGPHARVSLMIGVESGWPGAQAAYDYLWPFLAVASTSGPVPDLAERAGWALDFGAPVESRLAAEAVMPSAAAAMSASQPMLQEVITPLAAAAAVMLPESIPDFSSDPSRSTIQSAQSGNWSTPATWQGGLVPTANHVVRVVAGHTVTINDTSALAYTIAVDGKLAFAPSVNTRLKVTNLEVMAGEMGMGTPGVLEVGTAATPIAAGVTAEIVIANSPLGGSVADPEQFGTGLIVFGKAIMHGSVRAPTFVRVATEPRAGNTTLTLSEAAVGWKIGDRVVLPDTRHIKESEVVGSGWMNAVNQWEERAVQGISADGKTLTLNSALQYDHLGARDLNGVLDFLPHVGNLTRNVIVRSESAVGTRGHMLSNHVANVDIRYVLFKDLGRTTYLPLNTTTNHIGRYPIHMHHVSGPVPTPANGYQFTLIGNAIDGGSVETKFKWGVAVHGSHYGLIQDNVIYNYNGAAVATEDGSESFNLFDHNFALRGIGQPNDAVSEARQAMGTEGVGFWFRGPNNYVTNNVAANYQNPTTEAAYGFVVQLRYLGNIAVPNFKGADTFMATGQSTIKNGNNMPLLQFDNNEAYGAMQGGFTLWWVSSQDPQPYANAQETVIRDLKLWNIYNKTVYMYPSQKITFDRLKIRGSFSSLSRCCGNGVYFADYSSKGIVIRNADIQGMEEGITAPEAGFGPEPNLIIENSYLRNHSNVLVPTNGSVNGCWMQNKLVVITNTRFAAPAGRGLSNILMVRDVAYAPECLSKLDEARVYAYNGVATDNFQIYHSNTAVLPRPPSGCTPTTRTGINGLLCPIAALGPVPPTATLSASPASISAGQSATLTWSTTNATTVSINQGIGTVALSGTRSVAPAATTTYTLTATNANGSVTATTSVTVNAADTTAPVISGAASSNVSTSGATISFATNESSYHQVEYGPTTAYGTMTALDTMLMTSHSTNLTGLAAGTVYHYRARASDAAGNAGMSGGLTFTTLSGSVPTATLSASPASITSGGASTLTWSTGGATTVSINQTIGTVAASGTRSVSPTATTTYTLTATNGAGSVTRTATVTVAAAINLNNKARANAYDDVWQDGASGWVANAQAILAGGTGQVPGLVLWIGDSLTRDPALGAWAQGGAGKTAEDQMIASWMHAGSSPQSIDSIDGFALATPYMCPARSYTVGDGLGSWHFMGASSMPADTNPTTAKQKLQDCTAYPGALNLTTMLAALPKAQFAIPEVNLDAANPGSFQDFEAMVDLMIAKGIVPIIITYTYRTDAAFNQLVDQYNAALVQYAQTKKLPLIDLNREMLDRLPFAQWPGRFLSDGVHYTRGTATYPSTADPYANGGDPATHTTGIALTYDGYGLKGWLGVQKMKEIKQLVVDNAPDAAAPVITGGASSSVTTSGATITFATNEPSYHQVEYGLTTAYGTMTSLDSMLMTGHSTGLTGLTAGTVYHYRARATDAAGNAGMSGDLTFTTLSAAVPTATFSAAPASIASGGTSTLTWSAAGATIVSINQTIGTVAASGTRSVSPTATTTYTLTATNAAGSVTADATVTVGAGPLAITNSSASNITTSSMRITWTTSVASNSRVDYGTTTAYGASVTDPALVTSHTMTLSGLSPSTVYHYRITSQAGTETPVSTADRIATTATPDTTPPTITLIAPAAGATGVATAATVKATFNERMTASSITASTFVLRDAANAVVAATVSYSGTTRVATLTPTQPLVTSKVYTATVTGGSAGVKDLAGNALASNYVSSFTTAAAASAAVTIWGAAATPAAIATNDSSSVELGLKFRSDVAGKVTGVRFYKGTTSTGTHTGTLWSGSGVKLATVTFTGETASGWQQAIFATPVAITANTTYVVSYHTNVGNYAYSSGYFAAAGIDKAPLHALSNSVGGGNGVFRYGATAFPNSTYNSTNYWVDVVFVP
jgi:hypothetical protein